MSIKLTKKQSQLLDLLGVTLSDDLSSIKVMKEQKEKIEGLYNIPIDDTLNEIIKRKKREIEPTVYTFNMHYKGNAIECHSSKAKRPIFLPIGLFKEIALIKDISKVLGE